MAPPHPLQYPDNPASLNDFTDDLEIPRRNVATGCRSHLRLLANSKKEFQEPLDHEEKTKMVLFRDFGTLGFMSFSTEPRNAAVFVTINTKGLEIVDLRLKQVSTNIVDAFLRMALDSTLREVSEPNSSAFLVAVLIFFFFISKIVPVPCSGLAAM